MKILNFVAEYKNLSRYFNVNWKDNQFLSNIFLQQMLESVESFIEKEVNDKAYNNYDDDSYMDGDGSSIVRSEYDDDESSYYARGRLDSWQSFRSSSPTTPAVLSNNNSNDTTSLSKASEPKPYVDTSTRLAAIFPAKRSSQMKSLILALETVTASFDCLAQQELKYVANSRQELVQTREKYQALVYDHQRISQEVHVRRLIVINVKFVRLITFLSVDLATSSW